MNYIVLDLEFNQPFDFEDGNPVKPISGIPFEIIQIGMVKLNENLEIVDTYEATVRPVAYKRLHPFVAKITNLTTKDLFDGTKTLPQLHKEILNFVHTDGERTVLIEWGGADINYVFRNFRFHKLNKSLIPKEYIDFQYLASKTLNTHAGGSPTIGLKKATELLEIPQDMSFHNALSDAVYTAKVMQKVTEILNCKTEGEIESLLEKHVKIFSKDSLEASSKKSSKSDFFVDYNINSLHKEAERLFEKKLTKQQLQAVRRIYELGAEGKFNK